MTNYKHTLLPDYVHPNYFTLNNIRYPKTWWENLSEHQIIDLLGFEQIEEPEIDLYGYNANKRWEKENGGITLSGMHVHTDDRSKMMILGARVKADNDPFFTTHWKTENGFMILDSLTIIGISEAVLNFIDSCFRKEADIDAMITAGTITTTKQIDDEWDSVSNVV